MENDDEYNVNNFTDEELFHLMDLNNPTDRELEAKLYLLIEKYEGIKNKLSVKMCRFFNDVFRHFFSTDDEIEQEGFETQNTNNVSSQSVATIPTAPTPPVTTVSSNYSKGLLNPLLKESIKRIVCVDSQYRDLSVYPNPANFTFNLSDTLTDVVSLKLYSVQIPYTWYTISNDFGSNFFLLKGNVQGIDNGNFDLKVEIQPGNYQSNDMVTYINESLSQLSADNEDVNFGTTIVSYNTVNAKLTMNLDIKLLYNETNYQLQFFDPIEIIPNNLITDISNNLISFVDLSSNVNNISSIPELLGFTYNNHYPFSIKSNIHTGGLDMSIESRINNKNNRFFIDIYKGVIVDDKITGSISPTTTIAIKMSLFGIQKVSDIIADVDLQLKRSQYIDASNSSFYYDTTEERMILKVRLNRKEVINGQNYKTKIRFLDNRPRYPVWFKPDINGFYTSLFKFPRNDIELNEIKSDTDYLKTTYEIQSSDDDEITFILPTLSFICNNPIYQFVNQIIDIPGGIYSSIELVEEIDNKFVDLKQRTGGEFDCSFSTNILSFPVISSNINKIIPYYESQSLKKNFTIKVDNSFFTSVFGFSDLTLNIDPSVGNVSVDHTFENDFFLGNNLTTITDASNKIYITMNLNDGSGDIFTDMSFEVLQARDYDLPDIQTGTNLFFNGQHNLNMVSFTGSSISIIQTNSGYKCTLILKITVVLTNTNFDIHLDDPVGNMWSNFLGFNGHKFDVDAFPIELSGSIVEHNSVEIPNYDLSGKSLVDSSGLPLYNFSNNTLFYNSTGTLLVNYPSGRLKVIDLNGDVLAYDFNESPPLQDSIGNNLLYDVSGVPITSFSGLIPLLYDFKRVYFYTPSPLFGRKKLPSNLLYLTSFNNHFKFKAVPDRNGGVYVNDISTKYDIEITLSLAVNKYYTREAIVEEINSILLNNQITNGSYLTEEEGKTLFKVNINKNFTAQDYRLVFFDNTFTQCSYGKSSIDNVKWDTTLGWILGFRNQIQYILTEPNMTINLVNTTTYYTDYPNQLYSVDPITSIVRITGDTSINVNLFNYLLVVLDDYCQNHLNDGLVTVTKTDYDIPLPSYANRTTYQCDASGQLSIVNGKLTSKQLYSANQILNTKQINQKQNVYSSGPFTQDIFALIPIKTSGLNPGQSIVDFSGTLQNQERTYFGPVNIRKMTIQLLNDKGSLLDLNGANWSFSFISEQLYNPSRN